MSGFVALHRDDDTNELLAKHPNAFLLLAQIALRARWKEGGFDGLRIGQAQIGDWENAGIATIGKYKQAKKVLESAGLATFRGTNRGTVATLVDYRVFSLNAGATTSGTTTQQPSSDHQATIQQPLTNKVTRKHREQGNNKESLPLPFVSDGFAKAWDEWKGHRREIRKPLTSATGAKQLAKLAAMGEAAAIATIDHSIAGGWQGLFPPTQPKTGQPGTPPRFAGIQENIELP
jgi:hypothetical protein